MIGRRPGLAARYSGARLRTGSRGSAAVVARRVSRLGAGGPELGVVDDEGVWQLVSGIGASQ